MRSTAVRSTSASAACRVGARPTTARSPASFGVACRESGENIEWVVDRKGRATCAVTREIAPAPAARARTPEEAVVATLVPIKKPAISC
jgi:hypothetical protein